MLYWGLEQLRSWDWWSVWQGLLQCGLQHKSFKTSRELAFGWCTTNILYGICVTATSTLWWVRGQVHWDKVLVKTLNHWIILKFFLLSLMKIYYGKNLDLSYAKVCLEGGQLNFTELNSELLKSINRFYPSLHGDKPKNLSQKALVKLLIPIPVLAPPSFFPWIFNLLPLRSNLPY